MTRKYKYDWESVRHLMGVETDTVIAEMLNCSIGAVGNQRNGLGISRAGKKRPVYKYSWKLMFQYLGTMGDTEIAHILNCNRMTVGYHRRQRNIEHYRPRTSCPVCGKYFVGKRSDSKACSRECQISWAHASKSGSPSFELRSIWAAIARLHGMTENRPIIIKQSTPKQGGRYGEIST